MIPKPGCCKRRVPAIGGRAADIARDEVREVLYKSNFTAKRVELVSTRDGTIRTPVNVVSRPGSLALSPHDRLAAVALFAPSQPSAVPQ